MIVWAGSTWVKEGRICRKNEEQNRHDPQGSNREESNCGGQTWRGGLKGRGISCKISRHGTLSKESIWVLQRLNLITIKGKGIGGSVIQVLFVSSSLVVLVLRRVRWSFSSEFFFFFNDKFQSRFQNACVMCLVYRWSIQQQNVQVMYHVSIFFQLTS